jgi:hypothetical protein
MNNYRFVSYATPSATWTYDKNSENVTLFWKANGKKITYTPSALHYEEHKNRIIRNTLVS